MQVVALVPAAVKGDGIDLDWFRALPQALGFDQTVPLTIVPIVNYGTREELEQARDQLASLGSTYPTVYEGTNGLRGALGHGMKRVCDEFPGNAVVCRFDAGTSARPTEHRRDLQPELVAALVAAENESLVVGDLDFANCNGFQPFADTPEGILDRWMHLYGFPTLYREACKIPLSCAHGNFVARVETLNRMLPRVEQLLAAVPGTWGLDGATVLAACYTDGIGVIHHPVAPHRRRDERTEKKIVAQFAQAAALCITAAKLWGGSRVV